MDRGASKLSVKGHRGNILDLWIIDRLQCHACCVWYSQTVSERMHQAVSWWIAPTETATHRLKFANHQLRLRKPSPGGEKNPSTGRTCVWRFRVAKDAPLHCVKGGKDLPPKGLQRNQFLLFPIGPNDFFPFKYFYGWSVFKREKEGTERSRKLAQRKTGLCKEIDRFYWQTLEAQEGFAGQGR